MDNLSDNITLGGWTFKEVRIEDIDLYSEYIKETEYPANLWVSNFAYIWASSQGHSVKKLYRIIDDMLVTFTYLKNGILHLSFLPFGVGSPEKVVDVAHKCMEFCYKLNNNDYSRTVIKVVNNMQLEFLQKSSKFNRYFKLKPLIGMEKHFSIQKLISLSGKELETVRRKINKFKRLCPDAVIRDYRKGDYVNVFNLGKQWSNTFGQKYSFIFDGVYFPKIIKNSKELDQIVLVVEYHENLVGMVSGGILPTGQSWWSLSKYTDEFDGIPELLIVELSKRINEINPKVELMNAAQDFGPGGLRFFKERFRPALDLNRYTVKLRL